MKSRIDGEFVFVLALVAFVIAMLVATLEYPPLLRYTPYITGGLTLLFLCVLLAGRVNPRILTWTEAALQDMWGGGADGQKLEQMAEPPSSWPAVLRVMGYAVAYLLAVYLVGFFLVTPVFISLYLIADAKVRPAAAISVAAVLSFLLIVALVNLHVDLWIGVAPEIIPDYVGGAIPPQL
jgi:hypothetical protein